MGRHRSTFLILIAVALLFFLLSCFPRETKKEPRTLGKLAYVQGGNIWIKALPDGEAVQLTTDGVNHSPKWSPSSRWVFFRKDEGRKTSPWLVELNGENAHPVPGFRSWSPTRDRFAFMKNRELWTVDADGSNPRCLVANLKPSEEIQSALWHPEETRLAFDILERDSEGGLTGQSIRNVSDDGETGETLYSFNFIQGENGPEPGEIHFAGWDGQGRYLLFWQNPIVSASLAADGGDLYALREMGLPQDLGESMLMYGDFLAISPGVSHFAVTGGAGRATWTGKRIDLIDPASGNQYQLTDETMTALWPAWSPGGKKIAFSAGPDIGELGAEGSSLPNLTGRRIWIMNADGSGKRQITTGREDQDEKPLWSNQRTHLLFVRTEEWEKMDLWLVDVNGRGLRCVVEKIDPPERYGMYGYVHWGQSFDWWSK